MEPNPIGLGEDERDELLVRVAKSQWSRIRSDSERWVTPTSGARSAQSQWSRIRSDSERT